MQRKELSQQSGFPMSGGVLSEAKQELLKALPPDLAERLMRLPLEKKDALINQFSIHLSRQIKNAFTLGVDPRVEKLKLLSEIKEAISLAEMSAIEVLNKSFNFDWNDYRTIAPSKKKISAVQQELDSLVRATRMSTLSAHDQSELSDLFFKLGTYYSHVDRNPDKAYSHLMDSANYGGLGQKIRSLENQFVFIHQQWQAKAVAAGNLQDAAKRYAHVVKSTNDTIRYCLDKKDIGLVKETAFAYCVQALAKYENGELDEAVNTYRAALDLYEEHQLLDDQYARAKNRYAQFLAAQNKVEEANEVFLSIESYWTANKDKCNPYAFRFYLAYAEFLEKACAAAPELSLDKYKSAHEILCVVDGAESPLAKDVLEKIGKMEGAVHAVKETPSIYNNNPLTVFQPKPDQVALPDYKPLTIEKGPQ